MSEMTKKPAIRFKDFTDAWEQRKFGECFIEHREKSISENEEELLTCAIEGIFLNSEYFSHQRGQSNIGYIKVKYGDLILSAQNLHLGNANVNLKYENGIISPAYKAFSLNLLEPLFVQAWVKQDKTKDYFLLVTTEGASVCRKNVVWEWLNDKEFYSPNINEQIEIGNLFKQLDNLITLHQCKYDKLVNVKKSLLEKMFPSDGDKVPKIRFKGFTDTWEQRKLSYYIETSHEKNIEKVYSIEDVLSVSGDFGVVNQIAFQGRSFAGVSVQNYGVLRTNDIVYTKSPLKANPYGIIKTNKGKTGIVSVLYGIYTPNEKVDSVFVQTYFEENARLNNYLRPLVNKGAKNTLLISDEDSINGDVSFPKVDEQKKIGSLFERLDNLITLHQRKLEKLKCIKKSLLEKMFV